MENEQRFHFRVRVGEIEVEAAGSEEYIKDVRAYAEQLVSSSLTRMRTMGAVSPQRDTNISVDSEKPSAVTVSRPLGKDESIAEFLERVPSRTHQDKILAFSYYLEKNRGLESFGVKEINDCYDESKESKSNTAQYVALLVKSGLLMKARNQPQSTPTRYVLTRKGEAAIKNALGSSADTA